ncbi:MAG: type II toxin-antitoxin system RelE/ParE family toxin [Gemmatimonadota bacterium]|nr:type II toxin-antitoxin system RelE/ParE family toxin [Gemmatimonadota bacterium]
MISGFRHRGLERLFEKGDGRRIPPGLIARVERILARLYVAAKPADRTLPGLRLHPLKGDRPGCWAVKVSANWRVIFRFDGRDVRDVDLTDYH